MNFVVGAQFHTVADRMRCHGNRPAAPCRFGLLEIDLDRRDAALAAVARQCVGEVVARPAARHSHAVEATRPAIQRILTIGRAQHINVGSRGIRSLNLGRTIDALHFNSSAGLKLKTLANLIANFTLLSLLRYAQRRAKPAAHAAMRAPHPKGGRRLPSDTARVKRLMAALEELKRRS